MKVTQPTDTTVLVFTEIQALDPIRVYLTDHSDERGGITITCFGEAWSYYWGAMGKGSGIVGFFLSCDVHYLAKKLQGQDGKEREPDFDAFKLQLHEAIDKEGRLDAQRHHRVVENNEYADGDVYSDCEPNNLAAKYMGTEWYLDIPTKETSSFEYLRRIVKAVQEGLTQWRADSERETSQANS